MAPSGFPEMPQIPVLGNPTQISPSHLQGSWFCHALLTLPTGSLIKTSSSISDKARDQAEKQDPGIGVFKSNLIGSIQQNRGTDNTILGSLLQLTSYDTSMLKIFEV